MIWLKKTRRLRVFLHLNCGSGSCKPVACIERTAHAQRQWRHVDEFVGWHRFTTVCNDLLGLIRPIPLANVWGAGYRKE